MTGHSGSKSFTLKELAELVEGDIEGDPSLIIRGVNSLERAKPDEISFLSSHRWIALARKSSAGAIITKTTEGLEGRNLLISADPYLALAKVASLFYELRRPHAGISSLAFVHDTVKVGEGSAIMPFSYIDENSVIGRNCIIYPNVSLGRNVKVGDETIIYPHVVIYDECEIGARCIIHAGAIIGADGFGFARDKRRWLKIPQIGKVVIEDEVEIGAGTTIDRATFGETRIGRGTKLDNLVQVGHNVKIGKNCVIVSQTGISGSVEIEDDVMIGGQVGIVGHIKIGRGAKIGAKSGVHRNVEEEEEVSGIPILPHKKWLKLNLLLKRMLKKNGS